MAVTDDAATQFASFVKARTYATPFITLENEREMLEQGVLRWNLTFEDARSIMLRMGGDSNRAFQSEVERVIGEILGEAAAQKNMVSRDQFERAATLYRVLSLNVVSLDEARRHVKRIMLCRSWRPRRRNLIAATKWWREIEA